MSSPVGQMMRSGSFSPNHLFSPPANEAPSLQGPRCPIESLSFFSSDLQKRACHACFSGRPLFPLCFEFSSLVKILLLFFFFPSRFFDMGTTTDSPDFRGTNLFFVVESAFLAFRLFPPVLVQAPLSAQSLLL